MIIFKKIRYKNFLSTGNHFSEFDFSTHASTLITGSNGSGKCLHPSTEIDIMFESDELKKQFENFLKNRA